MKCERCGLEVDLPFKCNYCERFYCPDHRLPENHECAESWRVKAVRSTRAASSPLLPASATSSTLVQAQTQKMRFSSTEIRHLTLGTALVTLAGISFMVGRPLTVPGLFVSAVLFSLGFILHELAHKYVAQGYGLWAEFRVNKTGLLLTAISVISPFKLIAPGAVVIAGYADKDRIGRTAFAGPLVNIVITAALLIALPIVQVTWLRDALLAGAAINAFLALINLIPFTVLDGQKVFSWNRTYWAVLISISLALTIYTNFIL